MELELEVELLYEQDHQRFYRLNFPVSIQDDVSTHYLCLSDACVMGNCERYAFPLIRQNGENEDYIDLTIYYLEVDGYRVPEEEGGFDIIPTDSSIIESLFISYKNDCDFSSWD